jgi:putative transcriptional regulator
MTTMKKKTMAPAAFKALEGALRDAVAHSQGKPSGFKERPIPEVDVGSVREQLSLSQEQFSNMFGVGIKTVQNWEQGRRKPHGAARVLLNVIRSEPEAVMRAIGQPGKRR